jgi:hypothetical protein
MKYVIGNTVGVLLLTGLLWGPAAMADSLFVIADPEVDFEVIDYDPWDGLGDVGPFYTFNDALIGTEGEIRSMAEFDISGFSVPPGEFISDAMFEVKVTEIDVFGMGVDGDIPSGLAVDGYVGDGVDDLSDFEAGDGNVLDTVATPAPEVGQVLRFRVTSYVTDLVDANESYVGLTLRAESFGGLMFEEGDGFPKLTIQTVPEPGSFALCALASLLFLRRRRGASRG